MTKNLKLGKRKNKGDIIMNKNKLIARALLEIAKIDIPSPDLMVMKTVYAEIDKVNLNGVILPRKAVEKGLDSLIGKQCNWEHDGSGFVCGYTISAKIKKDKIETKLLNLK